MSSNIAVVVAHPDDEILGCGGVIAKHARQGDAVHVLILAEGVTSRDPVRSPLDRQEELASLATCALLAGKLIGSSSVRLRQFPDNRMDSVPLLDIVKEVESFFEEVIPARVYTHHVGDLNIDHRCVHQSVVTASRPQSGTGSPTLLFFETVSSTEWQTSGSSQPFTPNWFEDISDTLDVKLAALSVYASEMRVWPHPRSIAAVSHLARWRGASVGVNAAEAFMLGRFIG